MAKKSLHSYLSKFKKKKKPQKPPHCLLLHCNYQTTPSSWDAAGPAEFSPRFSASPPSELIRAADRFFFSPDPTKSLIEDARLSAAFSSWSSRPSNAGSDGVAVVTASVDPYFDFRKSMQEMVEARHVDLSEPLDWEFLEELLFCYLDLNDRGVHDYIVTAFADLTKSLRRRFGRTAWRSSPVA